MAKYLSNLTELIFFAIIFVILEIIKSEIMTKLKNSIREATLM